MEQIKNDPRIGQTAQQVGGTVLSAMGSLKEGNNANKLAKYQARQMETNAKQAVAEGTFAAEEERRKTDLLASRAMAVAAASGGGALDPTVVKILQGIESQGSLNSATEMYNASESARGMTDQAQATRYSGKQAKKAGQMKAIKSVLSGAGDLVTTWG